MVEGSLPGEIATPMERRHVGRIRTPKPVLLLLVFGVFLVIVGITATGLVLLTTAHVTTNVLNQAVAADGRIVRGFVTDRLRPDDVATDALGTARAEELATALATLVGPGGFARVELRRPDGTMLLDDTGTTGGSVVPSTDWTAAADGRVAAAIVGTADSEVAGTTLATPDLLREYFPLVREGRVQAVVALWRDATPVVAALAAARRDILLLTMSAAVCVALVLYLVFRSAQARLTRQTLALLEASRRDPLTGLLNHGTAVEQLAASVERLRTDGGGVAVALLDIDNLGNLNDTRGHETGDAAIRIVAGLLERHLADALTARYGPDEFLVAVEGTAIGGFGEALEQLRAALADTELRVGDGERLPLTVSIAVVSYPTHGASVTELLANAGLTLHEAKASGGDAIRWAGVETGADPSARTFGVLQGLVLAVDAKDRYTKRHSEDVARYALFIAERIGLPSDVRRSLRIAGLLHDVGKIGIPDRILRKPGRLTEDEFAIVKQHVALGDAIVRDLPDLEEIRAAIRHHHERWDGDGYLHGLAAEEIPLLARIIAVGDTFSAMTTSRPYRKALSTEEAMRRLGDAAGSQLDERLVTAFIEGIETHPHPPLPGDGGTVVAFEPRPVAEVRIA
jgi:diguanylate cyclase (GGDEF)-like protein/putative nucleotidyltransferase with HDIG domain